MERFIEFEEVVSVHQLEEALGAAHSDIMILRISKLTGTVKIKTGKRMSKSALRRAFLPHKIKKIYADFPYQNVKTDS